jgi:hypothetical protein
MTQCGLDRINIIVRNKYGGTCLSDTYTRHNLKFKCKKGHEFMRTAKNVVSGTWCNECVNIDKLCELKQFAISNNCICVTDKYVSSMDTFEWRCQKGHSWKCRIDHVKINWCITCKKNNEHAQKSVELKKKVFEVLDAGTFIYDVNDEQWKTLTLKSNISLKCDKSHITDILITTLFKNDIYICGTCRGLTKHTIEEARELAKQRNGECLSDEYISGDKNLLWKCHYDHKWSAPFAIIKNRGSWCPKCNINVGEAITKNIFESMFGVEFEKMRPNWLDGLEMDGYNETLKLAFEYNGAQHYKLTPIYHKTEADFEAQKERDKRKNDLCAKANVTLITIPYKIKFVNIQKFVIDECKTNKIHIPFPELLDIATFKNIYTPNNDKMIILEQKIKEKDGKIIDKNPVYIHSKHKILVECKNGHQWQTTWDGIKQNKWCPKCQKHNLKYNIEKMRELAIANNGVCLSTEYVSYNKKLLWKCNTCQKQWETNPSNIINGHWCRNNCKKINTA